MRRLRWILACWTCMSLGAGGGTAQVPVDADLPPPGFGVLNQDHISVRFTTGDLEVRFLPLDERVLRLVAKDGYESLRGLIDTRRAAIDSAAREIGITDPGLALVTFFALRSDARFDPENLNLLYRNQLERPLAMIPVTGNFTGRQLNVRTQASAIYLFEIPLPVFEVFELTYGGVQSGAWSEALRRLERARVQVQARVQAADSSGGKP